MDINPYKPPNTPVEDPQSTTVHADRPKQVVFAVKLAAINYVVGIVAISLTWSYFSALQTVSQFLATQVTSLIVMVWIYYKIYVGRNWARILLMILSLLGMLSAFSRAFQGVVSTMPPLAKAQLLLGVGFNLTILWLLFVSPGREWFKKRSSAHVG